MVNDVTTHGELLQVLLHTYLTNYYGLVWKCRGFLPTGLSPDHPRGNYVST